MLSTHLLVELDHTNNIRYYYHTRFTVNRCLQFTKKVLQSMSISGTVFTKHSIIVLFVTTVPCTPIIYGKCAV